MQTNLRVKTWDSVEGEQSMQTGHIPSWQAMIDRMRETDLETASVLDFGCNRGGFLPFLYKSKPFHFGVGVDIAEDSVSYANTAKGSLPLRYGHNDILEYYKNSFDVAFSHEVVYLLPDLQAHAAQIRSLLKTKGVYYIAIGEYAENPLWERWKKAVDQFSPVPSQTWSLQQIARTFADHDFEVSVRRLVCDDFLPYDPSDDKYILSPMELLEFMTRYMIFFRMVKKS